MATINCEMLDDGKVLLELLDNAGHNFSMTFGDKDAALRLAGKIARTCGVEILYVQNEEEQ